MLRRGAALTFLLLLVLAAPASATITRGWAAGPSPKQVRALAGAVKLDDGRVLVAGGGDGNGYTRTAEIFDPVTNTWSQAGAMNAVRWGFVMVKLADGRVLAAGGQNGNSIAAAEIYDPKTNRWSFAGTMNYPRYVAAGTLLGDGTVLVTGGWTDGNNTGTTTAERFDPATNGWAPQLITAFPGVRGLHAVATLHDGRVLIAGGTSSAEEPKVTATFANGSWTTGGSTFWTHAGGTLSTLPDGRALLAGGEVKTTERYDPAKDSWSPGPAMVSTRGQHTATTLANGKVLLVGGTGDGGAEFTTAAELYDPVSNTIAAAGSLAVGRMQQTATLLADGRVLITGGFTNGGSDGPGVEIWTPTASLTTEPAIALGDVAVGATRTAVVQLTNTSDSPLLTEALTIGGPGAGDFTVGAGQCHVVAAGATCAVAVHFTPSAEGARAATLTFNANTIAGVHAVPLSGRGVVPVTPPLGGAPNAITDTDGDGIPDAADRCASLKGTLPRSGCPAGLLADPSISYRPSGHGIRIVGYYVKATTGARVVVTCSKGCKKTVTKGRGSKRVRITRLNGRRLVNGTKITISVSMPGRLTTTVTDRIAKARRVEGRPSCAPVTC